MTAWENLENEVLAKDLCIGCGGCAGVCPVDVLEMQFDEYGYLAEIKKIEQYKKNLLAPARYIKNIILKVIKK